MAHPEDKRNVFDDDVFSYRTNKDGKVFLFWHERQVMVLKDKAARTFLAKVEGLDRRAAQLAMAKITGHFKHGNER